MEEYKSNSHRSREEKMKSATERKKVEKVITGTAKPKKKSEIQRLADIFIAEDVASVKSYVIDDVLIPAIKKAISDIVTNGIDMVLYGQSGRRKKDNTTIPRISYRDYYSKNDRDDRTVLNRTRSGYAYDDIILNTRRDAEAVLASLDELIDVYGMASISDLNDLVGITGRYTDCNYGWQDIHDADVVSVRDGFMIRLPKAIPLN
ncbi:MAG: hypothetical protein Q4C65_02600 [Eubacteriales bacterium]|nr:hypothetical protein [Eubacteriales bacterium]